MINLTTRQQLAVGLGLFASMIATRGQHWASLNALPDASWAVFFLAGVYLRPRWVFPALVTVAGVSDFASITWGGVSSYCISPAYGFLLPAYAALWPAGRWYAGRHRGQWSTVAPLSLAVLLGTAACELFSSGGFYFFSGRFAETTVAEFADRLTTYFPGSLENVAFYVGIAAVIHLAIARTPAASGWLERR